MGHLKRGPQLLWIEPAKLAQSVLLRKTCSAVQDLCGSSNRLRIFFEKKRIESNAKKPWQKRVLREQKKTDQDLKKWYTFKEVIEKNDNIDVKNVEAILSDQDDHGALSQCSMFNFPKVAKSTFFELLLAIGGRQEF